MCELNSSNLCTVVMALPAKYPKTPHLPFSPGVQPDDIVCSNLNPSHPLLTQEVVITEKLDGGNCSLLQSKVYARTTASEATHPSFGVIKELAAGISVLLPADIQVFGENMFAVHSIEYDDLDAFFYVFGALDQSGIILSWDSTVEIAESAGLATVPLCFRGKLSSGEELRSWVESHMREKSACGSTRPEGFVVRTATSFPSGQFENQTAKYVRAGHIQTDEHWKRTWKASKLTKL